MKKDVWRRITAHILAGAVGLSLVMGTAAPILASDPDGSDNVQTAAAAEAGAADEGGTGQASTDGGSASIVGQKGEQADVYKVMSSDGTVSYVASSEAPVKSEAVTGTITVNGITEKSQKADGSYEYPTVKAYQLADGYYTSDGLLVKYVVMDPINAPIAALANGTGLGANKQNDIITEQEITKAAKAVANGSFKADAGTELNPSESNGTVTYTGNFEPGLYLILVTGLSNSIYIYNPAVASVNITSVSADGSTLSDGSVDMTKDFEVNGSNVYVKSTTEGNADKKTTGSSKLRAVAEGEKAGTQSTTATTSGHGDTVAMGDTVSFSISNIKVPSFTQSDINDGSAYFYITDELSAKGFTPITNFIVYIEAQSTNTGEDPNAPALSSALTSLAPTDEDGHYTNYTLSSLDGSSDYILTKTEDNNYYSVVDKSGNGVTSFRISFTKEFLNHHKSGTNTISVSYQTTLSGNADLNFAENKNHAEIYYSNGTGSGSGSTSGGGGDNPGSTPEPGSSPNPGASPEPGSSPTPGTSPEPGSSPTPGTTPEPGSSPTPHEVLNTYHYTFGIDAYIDSQLTTDDPGYGKKTKEIRKVTDVKTSTASDGSTTTTSTPVKDAVFTLYSDAECTNPVKERTVDKNTGKVSIAENAPDYTATSGEDGYFGFTGLDEGTYYIKETKAPAGYTISDTIYKAVISAALDDTTGVLKEYSVNISSKSASAGDTDFKSSSSAKYTSTATIAANGDVTQTVKADSGNTTTEVVDTKIPNLPSTGGTGIMRFIIIAIAFGAAFVVFTLATRRKKKS